MKKQVLLALSAAALLGLGGAAIFGASPAHVSAGIAKKAAITPSHGQGEVAVPDYTQAPAQGEHDDGSYLRPVVEDTNAKIGVKRVSQRSVIVNQKAAWGVRAELDRLYDASDFEISIDLSGVGSGSKAALMFGFGSGTKAYPSTGNYLMNFDIIHNSTEDDLWRVCLANNANVVTNDHAGHAVEGFSETTPWSDDSAFIGHDVHLTDGTLTIHMEKVSDTAARLTVNGEAFDMAYDDIYRNFDPADYVQTVYFSGLNTDMLVYQINYVADPTDDTYYAADSAFFKTEKALAAAEATVDTKKTTVDGAHELYNSIVAIKAGEKGLNAGDRGYYAPRIAALEAAVQEAKDDATIGEDVKLAIYEEKIASFEASVTDIQTYDDLVAASKAKTVVDSAKEEFGDDMTDAQKATLASLDARVAACNTAIANAVKTIFTGILDDLASKVNAINSTEALEAAYEAKENIDISLLDFLGEEDKATMMAAYNTALENYKTKTTFTNSALTVGSKIQAVYANDRLNVLTDGSSVYGSPDTSAAIFSKEKVDATNFEMKFILHSVTGSNTFALGIMEKADFYSTAQDPSCTDNLGIFFTVVAKNSTTVSVQKNVMNLSCTRFYDAQLNSMTYIDMPLDQEVTFRVESYEKTTAGITESYVRYSFNDTNFDLINTTKLSAMKSMYGSKKEGYFFIGTQDSSHSNRNLFEVLSVNGHKMTDTTFVKGAEPTPTSSESTTSSESGESSAQSSQGGETKKGGCGGSILASSALVGILALGGVAIAVKSKKKGE